MPYIYFFKQYLANKKQPYLLHSSNYFILYHKYFELILTKDTKNTAYKYG